MGSHLALLKMSLKRNSTVAQLWNNDYLTLWTWKMNGDENFVVIDNILFHERHFLTENAVHVINIEITIIIFFNVVITVNSI